LAVLVVRLVFGVLLFTAPDLANAGLMSSILSFFSPDAKAEDNSSDLIINSQTIPLLKSAVNNDPVSGQGGGDITVIGGTALLSETGPSGSMADIETESSAHISVYVVRPGDTISGIAKMFGVSVNTVIWSNDISRGLIREGQTLIILPITGVRHIVKSGDTLESISKKYKGDAEEIAKYNSIALNTKLKAGDVIIVPDGEMPITASNSSTARLRGAGGPEYVGYYMRPIVGGRRTQGLHGYNGVDLASSFGAEVYAAAGGTVIVAKNGGWNGGYGTYAVISHPNGTQTLYSHLSGITVVVGQRVSQGQLVGYIGSTGRSTGPHLHFEIRGAKNPF
jgi:murein DD-endopeptidase MepM/ murein hydrolase activator NlpD